MVYTVLLLVGALFYPLTYQLCVKLLYATRVKQYGNALLYEISNRLVSSIHAIQAVVVALYIMYSCQNDILQDKSLLVQYYSYFGVSYFLYDVWCMFIVHRTKHNQHEDLRISHLQFFMTRKWIFVIHHLGIVFVGFPLIVTNIRGGLGDYFIGCIFLTEASSPFVNLTAILNIMNLRNTSLYIINGLATIIVFFLCRVLIFLHMYHAFATYKHIPLYQVPLSIPVKCNAGCLLILSFQVYWLALMLKVGYRVLWLGERTTNERAVTNKSSAITFSDVNANGTSHMNGVTSATKHNRSQ